MLHDSYYNRFANKGMREYDIGAVPMLYCVHFANEE